MRVITLLTDFGTRDAYVGAMKGAILNVSPSVAIVDICHDVPPRDILAGAFLLGGAYASFPPETVHVAVVDPGVGTRRRAVLLVTPSAFFLAPDNGLLSFVLGDIRGRPLRTRAAFGSPRRVIVPRGCAAYALTEPRYWRHPVSSTFHGRDIFAPVAGHLSQGMQPDAFGHPVSTLACLSFPPLGRQPDGAIQGHVLYVDRFGNLVTDLRPSDLPGRDVTVDVAGRRIRGVRRTYAEATGLVAIAGSAGYLEVALRDGDAARTLGAHVGDLVTVRRA
ncbi:MAG: SAM-dependent chlorinase/fluorinase [Dehalococcoidia bacterium]|nr:SAM-dependent chlorinase/fluorinase [Dehalococcoidia bacterium]